MPDDATQDSGTTSEQDQGPVSQQEKFREALARKQEAARGRHGEDHLNAGGVGGSVSSRSRKEFRRKSG